MLKKTITYTDYNGEERTEDFYFNLSKAELLEMELEVSGGLTEILRTIAQERDIPKLMEHFKKIITRSYGIKTADGKRFTKSQEITDAFLQTEAYSELFVELMDAGKAAAFVKAILPADVVSKLPADNSIAQAGNITSIAPAT